ncbi:RICIN domain-containing protein [Sphaerisporangium sp. NPDC051017]|uniref:RICIN domain-containing protein n=1 Tax=Sphaerisporangium sp. NPDC051017 TaxID=3154636 RepID=UPI003434DE24
MNITAIIGRCEREMTGVKRLARLGAAIGLGIVSVLIPSGTAAASYGPYEIISNLSHLCVDTVNGSMDDNAPIQQWWCWNGPPQRWTMVFVKTAYRPQTGDTAFFRLENQKSGKCLDVPSGNPTAGVKVQQWRCWDGDMQLWSVVTQNQTGTVQIRNLATDLCLDDTDWSNTPGNRLQQWPCNDMAPQQWYLL